MRSRGGSNERRDEMLLREHDNAWSHYRHLENSRGQYLGFLFTIAFATTAYAGTIHDVFGRPWRAVELAGLLSLVMILALVTHINVRKLGVALEHFRRVASDIRDDFIEADGTEQALLRPQKPAATNRLLRSRLFTVQGTSELVPLLLSVVAVGGQSVLAGHALLSTASTGPRVLLVALTATSVVLIVGLVAVTDRPY